MKKTDELIAQSITFAIDSISMDIQHTSDCHKNMVRAEAIAVLSIAYSAVRGRKEKWLAKFFRKNKQEKNTDKDT